jgi:hypothetical protein
MLKPKNPEVDEWKVVKAKVKGKKKNFKPTFDYLLTEYVNQKAESRDRSSKGSAAPSWKQDRSHSHASRGPARWGDADPNCRPSLRRVQVNQDPRGKIEYYSTSHSIIYIIQ